LLYYLIVLNSSPIDENGGDASAFWTAIGGKGPVMSAAEADKLRTPEAFEKVLFR
jgi:hypothetical protein